MSDGAWFPSFDAARHVTAAAEYDPALPVHLAIDCGVSRHVAAVWFQVMRRGRPLRVDLPAWIRRTGRRLVRLSSMRLRYDFTRCVITRMRPDARLPGHRRDTPRHMAAGCPFAIELPHEL